jgi:hypothetical protein
MYLWITNPTDADVESDAADVDVGDVLLAQHLLQVGVVQLLVVEEGGVRVDLGPETLVNDGALGVDLGPILYIFIFVITFAKNWHFLLFTASLRKVFQKFAKNSDHNLEPWPKGIILSIWDPRSEF